MKNIRLNVFETNSSSSHSFVVNNDCLLSKEEVRKELYTEDSIHISFQEFGWGYDEVKSVSGKLVYFIQQIFERYGHHFFLEEDISSRVRSGKRFQDIYNLDEECINEINDLLDELGIEDRYDDLIFTNVDGYIDHQSIEKYSPVDAARIILNPSATIIISNDN